MAVLGLAGAAVAVLGLAGVAVAEVGTKVGRLAPAAAAAPCGGTGAASIATQPSAMAAAMRGARRFEILHRVFIVVSSCLGRVGCGSNAAGHFPAHLLGLIHCLGALEDDALRLDVHHHAVVDVISRPQDAG